MFDFGGASSGAPLSAFGGVPYSSLPGGDCPVRSSSPGHTWKVHRDPLITSRGRAKRHWS
eukprot:3297291-Rhodomonas_salina.1